MAFCSSKMKTVAHHLLVFTDTGKISSPWFNLQLVPAFHLPSENTHNMSLLSISECKGNMGGT